MDQGVAQREAKKNAGDPGPVLARRLSNAEYDRTIRDLTGADIRPTREFPVDPANEAGFDNSGESLTMSPALLKKLLEAARNVADHLVLKPNGFDFATHAAITDVDRDKYCVRRIIEFYKKQQVDYADYFLAAWRFQHREALGKNTATLETIGEEAGLSAKYLRTIRSVLTEPQPEFGPLGELRDRWRKLPADAQRQVEVRRDCERLRNFVVRSRREFKSPANTIKAPGISAGSQPLVLWGNSKLAANHMRYSGGEQADPQSKAASELFCRVFPDAFFISDRAPYFDPKSAGQGRPLGAGFHLMQGYFRDDEPLRELILNDAEHRELDELWRELNFIADAPTRQYKDFIFFERAEPPRFMGGAAFDAFRSEDKDSSSAAKIKRLSELYIAKARKNGANDQAIEAIETYFSDINAELRRVEEDRRRAEPSHLSSLLKFAERAYRRPLAKTERDQLMAFYRESREKDELSHEDAIRDLVTTVLMSPNFYFRFDPSEPGEAPSPLSDYALASRLSYFLWSTMPDEELLSHAAASDLRRPEILLAQTRRMLRDDRVRAFAVEFGGNWLDFRRFEEHNGVDRGRFPSFTNELRQAMYEEPIRFFVDVVQGNRSALDFLDADHTFVNPILAKHYGIPIADVGADEWVRVENAGVTAEGASRRCRCS